MTEAKLDSESGPQATRSGWRDSALLTSSMRARTASMRAAAVITTTGSLDLSRRSERWSYTSSSISTGIWASSSNGSTSSSRLWAVAGTMTRWMKH